MAPLVLWGPGECICHAPKVIHVSHHCPQSYLERGGYSIHTFTAEPTRLKESKSQLEPLASYSLGFGCGSRSGPSWGHHLAVPHSGPCSRIAVLMRVKSPWLK